MEIKKDVAITKLIQMLEHTDDLYKASALEKAINALTQPEIIYCPECKYYCPPVCTFHKELNMVSRHGFCYHAVRGKYEGDVPKVEVKMDKSITEIIEEVKSEICDKYCKFEVDVDNEEELNRICGNCPLNRL